MTLYDFLYVVGYGTAFPMILEYIKRNGILTKEDEGVPCLFIILMISLLSWGIPIYYIGYKYFKYKDIKYGMENKRNNTNHIL